MKKSRFALFQSAIALLLCISMLIGTTFAWFTDGVSSGTNTIAAGYLDIEMEYLDANGNWQKVNESTEVLDKDALWEPGHTEVAYLKISNAGNLAMKYALGIQINGERGSVNAAGEPFKLSDHIRFGVVESEELVSYANRADAIQALSESKLISEGYTSQYSMNSNGDTRYATLVVYMPEEVGNAANYATGQEAPEVQLGIQLVATQEVYESDSFGSDYDTNAEVPGFTFPESTFGDNVSADVTTNEENQVAENVTIQGSNTNAVIPAGVQLAEGVEKLTLEVSSLEGSEANITLGKNDKRRSLNVHVEGVSADNTVPMEITLKEAAAKGLNAGNLKLYHVENGATVEMTAVDTFTAHNQFKYDPATGDITLYMATFSEVAVVADTENAWNGTVATAFAGGTGTEADPYIIANGDQLAYLGDRVSCDNDNYGSAHYKLIADVNIGGSENYKENGVIWYPIGYNKVGGEIATISDDLDAIWFEPINSAAPGSKDGDVVATAADNSWYTYGGSFRGVFDGTGHTVSGIYQNTWAMKGDYDGHYYNDAMGLFGYVNGGIVKNLTIDNFYSEGEFAPTGCVTAYAGGSATFENIAITNSHPQTYNTGVAGIVGWDNGNNSEFTFKNITVDSTNTMSALWGSWDVAAAGILGCLKNGSKANFENCSVSATIDVYNDVCGNYQYYWYRYSGAFIGTVYKRLDNGNGALDLSDVTAKNCTANFGDRHEYYYCEFVENTKASYTHDYQMSRVKNADIVGSGEGATCQNHNHEEHGYETVEGNSVLVEDKQAVYIPYRQLFGGYGWGVDGVDLGEYENISISDITVSQEKTENNFESSKFVYRVGNGNAIALSSLFTAKNGANINDSGVYVTIDKVNDNSNVSGEFKADTTDWEKGTIQFSGTGLVKVTIQDYEYSKPVSIELEVIDAVNATTATSATKNNVVLLNDCDFSSLEVSSGYTLYGNGFTMTCGSDSAALDMGYAFVTLNNGTLDNVQIVCPNYDYAALYKSNLTSSENRSETTDRTRYYNAKSGVMASGNSQILNSRISGGRASLNVSGGNVVVDNSRIELGAVASVLVGTANSLTLRDVTLIQKPTVSTHDSNKTLMGFSVLYLCDSEGNATPTTLEGSFVQQAWVNADDKKYVPSAGQDIVDGVMKETAFIHNINGKDSLNLGFAYMPDDPQKSVAAPDNITDNRTDKAAIPYEMKDVKIQIAILSTTVYVYSYKNSNGTNSGFNNIPDYVPDEYSDIITVTYADTAEGLTTGKSYGTAGWVYELNVDLDKLSGYAVDFSKLSMSVNGVTVTGFKVNGSAKPTSPVAVTAGGITYTLTAIIDGKEYTATYKVTGTETSKESPSLVASNYGAGLCVASSYGGTWSGAAPALEGIQIKYWSVAEKQYKTINLSDCKPTTKGKLNGTNNTWTYTSGNGDFTLTLTGGQVHSGNSVNAMPVFVDTGSDGTADTLYFVAASDKGLVNTGNSARAIPVSYVFTDNNNGTPLTFSHTWSVAENKDAQYKYSDFCNGTLTKLESSGGGCVTPDTLITLANGKQVRVDSLTGNEKLLVWNLKTGKYDTAPIVFVDSEEEAEYQIIHLYFSDGSDVKVIYEHGFFDLDLGKYVYIDAENYAEYIGHRFVTEGQIDSNKRNTVTLDKVVLETEVTTAWSPVTFEHLCYYTNGVLSMPGGIEGLFNIFEVNTKTMRYDAKQMQKDIETYGLFTLEDFGGMISEEAFEAFNGAYLKIAMGKGLLTWEDIAYMAERYIPLM